MKTRDSEALPLERQVEYVAALAAVGGVFAYISWAIVTSLLPDEMKKPDLAVWSATGMGLGGVVALVWLLSASALH